MARAKKETEESVPVEQPAEAAAAVDETPQAPEEADADPYEEDEDGLSVRADTGPVLESLSALADLYRLSTWEQAGVMQLMGWTDDKQVTAEDYEAALDALKNRRIGGGRRG